ncbi:ion channel [Curvibacter sp. HBC28]|uniref:Ion channel n=1 Tax=Curvibacter microcysteis TaxID=3026419 RepID=A0ABT5MAT4_9BURK|nr:ion channel [Curvibacter sp. HBC28]MDD0813698.1 ion channel [Curvibacter sp. HBC28]
MNDLNILNQITMGVILFAFGVLMQTLVTFLIHQRISDQLASGRHSIYHAAARLFISMSSLIVSAVIQSMVWAALYVEIGAFKSFYHSLFFSFSCFSTLGFANFLPDDPFKLLSALEGISGSLNMAWAGGIMYSLVNRFYDSLRVGSNLTEPDQS